ncbi:MAG: pyruvate carboxylase subunit B [Deltaproteobacteria bacterium]|nr:pyruvate carboxylase subunit B [Deltaproteobacteria bacterium]
MLLRGQNLVGYRNYPDDLVKEFVAHSADVGVDVFRVFDALNDPRNLATAGEAVKKAKKHFQATICYTITERKIGGAVFNEAYYRTKAHEMADLGADSLVIKDMAGMINPADARLLVRLLKDETGLPVHLHTHFTSGMADIVFWEAIKEGVDVIDRCVAPFAHRTSHAAVEPFLVALEGSDRDPGLDLEALAEIGKMLEKIAPKYRHFGDTSKTAVIDTGVLIHQIPGGMQSNMINQLRQADALHRLHEVHTELPQTRKDLGFPPLVTPTSQIVGTQAVTNVLMGRYKMVSQEVKDLCYGLYGKTPAPIDPKVRKICLKGVFARRETDHRTAGRLSRRGTARREKRRSPASTPKRAKRAIRISITC